MITITEYSTKGYRAIAFDSLSHAAHARRTLQRVSQVKDEELPKGYRSYWKMQWRNSINLSRHTQSRVGKQFVGGLA